LRRRGITHALAAIAMLPGSWANLWAQPPAETPGSETQRNSACFGKVVQSIEFPETSENDQQMLRSMIPIHEGVALDRGQLRESLRVLFATGRFANLRAECRLDDGKVLLSFPNTANFFVGRVSVEGAPGRPSESQIVNATKLQLGDLFTFEKAERATANIKRLLEDNNFYRATVPHFEQQDPLTQQVAVTFQIHAGDAARVGKIEIKGDGLFSQGQIEDMARLHPGDTVSAQRVASGLERIRKQYQKRNRWLAQVSIAEKTYVPDKNTVDYSLVIESGPVVEIRTEGFHLRKGTIRRNVPVYEEHALDDDLLNEGRRNLLSYMEAQGYFDAQVELRRESDESRNLLRVIYHITTGERHKIVFIKFTGNKYFREDDLRPLLHLQEASLVLTHGRFSDALLRSDVRDIENMYRANGFGQVKVTSQVEDNYMRTNHVAVKININEGPQTLVGSFQINGSSQTQSPVFQSLNTGQGQPFSDSRIADDRDIILNYYFNNGFPNATVEATAKPAGDDRINVTFNIQEGKRIYVDRVLVAGREYAKPFVINNELQMKSGDPLSQGEMLSTQQHLYDLGIFSQVDTAVQNPDGQQPRKNVLVQVQEAKRYTFKYGGGFEFQTGEGVSPLASFSVTRLNFRGRDHTITFDSRVGRLQQRGLISYEAPHWFNNPNWKLTFTGFFDHTIDVTTFRSQRLEGSVQAGQTINKFSSLDYRFNYRLVQATHISGTISPDQIPLLSLPVRVGEPSVGYIRNRRDNDLETTRGSYLTLDAGVAAHYFGSEADFSRVLAQVSTYHPFGKVSKGSRQFVFARSTRVGVENPFGNTEITQPGAPTPATATLIPLPERFFMGGGNSHRGFGLNQAGPRDPITGFPLGGSALFLNNFEIRFPPPTLPFVQDNMSFAIFHDMGNVFTDGTHMLDNLFRWHQNKQLCSQALNTLPVIGQGATLCSYNYISHAIGLGVRYKTPVGPVRFDFGYNLNQTVFPHFVQEPSDVDPNPNPILFKGTKQASPFNVYFSIGQTF
jgi:outer membrane protein insertion porin family